MFDCVKILFVIFIFKMEINMGVIAINLQSNFNFHWHPNVCSKKKMFWNYFFMKNEKIHSLLNKTAHLLLVHFAVIFVNICHLV